MNMQLWKLGCRWGSGTPLFYNFIKENSIVIGWIGKDYAVGDWLLITDGHTVLSFAEVLEKRKSVLDFPQYKVPFEEHEIPFDKNIFIYKTKHIHLKKEDYFSYPLQQGIVRVQKKEYVEKFNSIKQKYMIPNSKVIELLLSKKQIIFQGAPGTGKTYTTKDVAEQLIFNEVTPDKKIQAERLKTSEQFKLVQFHPSYTYEDFVRGIEVKTENGQPEYKTINKTLGKFAKAALDNWRDSQKDLSTLTKEKTFELQLEEFKKQVEEKIATQSSYKIEGTTAIITEVTDNAFRFTYEHDKRVSYTLLFSDLLRLDSSGIEFKQVKEVDEFDLLMKRKASYYFRIFNEIKTVITNTNQLNLNVQLKNYILIIDEINRANLPAVLGELIYALEYRGEKVESMYAVEDGGNALVLPPNLYIIGTMNTADRSVGQIDYAIRRRFAFVDMLPKVLTDEPEFDIDLFKKVSAFFIENIDEYISAPENTVLKKSKWLSDEFSPEDVWIGHSYFIMNDNRDIRLNYEIKPILREYLKDGILNEKLNGQDTKAAINTL